MILTSKQSTFLSSCMLKGIVDLKETAKKARKAFMSIVVSLFLLVSFSMGNVVNARENGASVGNTISSRKSNSYNSRGGSSYRTSTSNDQISSRTVEVEIVASGSSVKVNKPVEKKPSQLKKAYKRKKNQKSLTNDLYELEQEAEYEVKQSWDSLTGSMKGEDSRTVSVAAQCGYRYSSRRSK